MERGRGKNKYVANLKIVHPLLSLDVDIWKFQLTYDAQTAALHYPPTPMTYFWRSMWRKKGNKWRIRSITLKQKKGQMVLERQIFFIFINQSNIFAFLDINLKHKMHKIKNGPFPGVVKIMQWHFLHFSEFAVKNMSNPDLKWLTLYPACLRVLVSHPPPPPFAQHSVCNFPNFYTLQFYSPWNKNMKGRCFRRPHCAISSCSRIFWLGSAWRNSVRRIETCL